jgi:hypothetical protein
MLCEVCIGVIQHHRNKSRTWKSRRRTKYSQGDEEEEELEVSAHEHLHHLTFSSLADSMAGKCPICTSFWTTSTESEQDSMRIFDDVTEVPQSAVHSDHDISSESESEILTYMRISKGHDNIFHIYVRYWPRRSFPCLFVLEPGMYPNST